LARAFHRGLRDVAFIVLVSLAHWCRCDRIPDVRLLVTARNCLAAGAGSAGWHIGLSMLLISARDVGARSVVLHAVA
jgi:hypothetical protein